MTDFRGYPVVPCPDCGASDAVEIVAAVKPERVFGPGEWAVFRCDFCGDEWRALVPEPVEA
jgi:uncharacterized Zn finger protein